jgi:hypothetical protein
MSSLMPRLRRLRSSGSGIALQPQLLDVVERRELQPRALQGIDHGKGSALRFTRARV